MISQEIPKIYGKIQFVEFFPDYKVKVVSEIANLDVLLVKDFPNSVGKWQIVEHFPDFKIQIVDNFADFTIKYVEHFPGIKLVI